MQEYTLITGTDEDLNGASNGWSPARKLSGRESEEKALRSKTHVRAGITKNHSQKCPKSRRKMARQSRHINRQRG